MPCFGDDGDIDEEIGRPPGEQKYAKVSLHGGNGGQAQACNPCYWAYLLKHALRLLTRVYVCFCF